MPRRNASVSFDRAASYYDQTRRVSAATLERMIDLVDSEVPPGGRCLEVGVGTGAIALPLKARGVQVVGVDLSAEMLRRLREKAPAALPIAVADATALPLAGHTFDTAIARHVLHLIPAWREAMREMTRTVRPGGTVLVTGGCYAGVYDEIIQRFASAAGRDRTVPGLSVAEEGLLDEWMHSLGASIRVLDLGTEPVQESLAEFLEGIDRNLYSWTWPVDPATRRRAAGEVRRWTEERFGDLDRPLPAEIPLVWKAYDLPG